MKKPPPRGGRPERDGPRPQGSADGARSPKRPGGPKGPGKRPRSGPPRGPGKGPAKGPARGPAQQAAGRPPQRARPARPPSPDPAREAAARLVEAVLSRSDSLSDAMALSHDFRRLEGRDRAFAGLVALETIRWAGAAGACLERMLDQPLAERAPYVNALLLTAIVQLFILESPPHAVIDRAVALAKADPVGGRYGGLVNAVLRRLDRDGRQRFDAFPPETNLPERFRTRWRELYGPEAVRAFAKAMLARPPLDLTVKTDAEGWAARLGGTALHDETVRLPRPAGSVAALPGYDDGAWWVQDVAAAMPARVLAETAGSLEGQRVLDLCAAPGGKTMQLAARGAEVTTLDIDPARLDVLRANLERTGLRARIVAADGAEWAAAPEHADQFGAVLLDAPCSATGTLRRHPDVLWAKASMNLAPLLARQDALLDAAVRVLKPGGVLVYAVCSLEPEEGPERAEAATERFEGVLETLPIDPAALGWPGKAQEGAVPFLRLTPAMLGERGGSDGFFIARWRKRIA